MKTNISCSPTWKCRIIVGWYSHICKLLQHFSLTHHFQPEQRKKLVKSILQFLFRIYFWSRIALTPLSLISSPFPSVSFPPPPQGASLPVMELTEVPKCTVCLERMDESVNGILTTLCNHSFHSQCLQRWEDASWVVHTTHTHTHTLLPCTVFPI